MTNPYDMHNFEHQKRQVEIGKRMSKYIDFFDLCIMGFLKHLIQIFVVLVCISFIYVIAITVEGEPQYDKYLIENKVTY